MAQRPLKILDGKLLLNDSDLLTYSEYFRNFEIKDQTIMDINFDDLSNLENLNDLSGTLRIIVTSKPLPANTDYLTWEHRDENQWIHEYEIIKGEVNSQRYAKYDRDGELSDCFCFN